MLIRPETEQDIAAIRDITVAAFEHHPYSNQTEHLLVDALREARALSVSLVAEIDREVVGHIAFSPITVDGTSLGWYGLAPVSVRVDLQRRGIGIALVNSGLRALRDDLGAHGCVLAGDSAYYGRFGFRDLPLLVYDGVPPEYFLTLPFGAMVPKGKVAFHPAFDVCL
jgi:putative acetyltransferase